MTIIPLLYFQLYKVNVHYQGENDVKTLIMSTYNRETINEKRSNR